MRRSSTLAPNTSTEKIRKLEKSGSLAVDQDGKLVEKSDKQGENGNSGEEETYNHQFPTFLNFIELQKYMLTKPLEKIEDL